MHHPPLDQITADQLDYDDTDVIDDSPTTEYDPATVTPAPAMTRLEQAKAHTLRIWRRPGTRWIALATITSLVLAGGGAWSILDTQAKIAETLRAAQASHTAAVRDVAGFADTAAEIADAAAPFGLDAERTALTDTATALKADLAKLTSPGDVTAQISARTNKARALKAPVTANLDAVLTGVSAATTAKLDGAALVSDDDKAPTAEAMTAVTAAFGTLTDAPAALTALAAAHGDLQGKQDAAQAAADAEAARVAEEAAAAAAAEEAARATGNGGGSSGTGASAGKATNGSRGGAGTGTGARGSSGGTAPAPGAGGGTAPGNGGGGTTPGNPGNGGGGGPAPYTSAQAAAAVQARWGASAPLGSCVQMNSGSFTPGSMIAPAWNPVADGGRLGWKAWAEGGRGHVVFYACE